jgi:hypothetical protein
MLNLEFNRQCEEASSSNDTNAFPAAQHCRKESSKGSPASWKILSRHEDTGAVTMQLLRDSWGMFKDLSLRDWADDVLDMPSAKMKLFRLYYCGLACSLFTFLRQFPKETAKYDSIISV